MNCSNLNIYNNSVLIDNIDIKVLQYLPIEDKNSIIQMALQNSEENTIYNEYKLQMYFELYITYMYSDIEFTEEEKEDEVHLYDVLKSNGIIEKIIEAIPRVEYIDLCNKLAVTKENKMKYRNSIASVINSFINELPANASAAKDIIEKFNPEDFMQVLKFAEAANGNRPIN